MPQTEIDLKLFLFAYTPYMGQESGKEPALYYREDIVKEAMIEFTKQILLLAAERAKVDYSKCNMPEESLYGLNCEVKKESITSCIDLIKP